MYEKQKSFLISLAYWAALLLLCRIVCRYVLLWVLPFLIALLLATLAEPLVDGCRRKMHLKRGFTAAVLTLLLSGGMIALTVFLVTGLIRQSTDLLTALPRTLSRLPQLAANLEQRLNTFCNACSPALHSWLDRFFVSLSGQFSSRLTSLSSSALEFLTDAVSALPQVFLFCATTALAFFFISAGFPAIKNFLCRHLTPQHLKTLLQLRQNLLTTLWKWMQAQAKLLSITFFELLLGFLLLREPYALLLSVLIALVDALPIFGTGTVLIPWSLLCFVQGNVPRGIALLALYAVIALVRSVTEPKIMASQVNLPPLAALAAMYVGFCTLRVPGMILFPVVLLFVKQLYDGGYIHLRKI